MRKMYAPLLAILIVLTFCLPGIAAVSTTHGMQMTVKTGSTVTTYSPPAVASGENGQLIISEEKARESLNSMFPEIIPGEPRRCN
ncbi:MAG: hypothetical protein PHZ03_06655 [Syntrophomonas sp.]|nr:hypothetical protein [Syntrophomonas sp.]